MIFVLFGLTIKFLSNVRPDPKVFPHPPSASIDHNQRVTTRASNGRDMHGEIYSFQGALNNYYNE